jgi:hypothetical protein
MPSRPPPPACVQRPDPSEPPDRATGPPTRMERAQSVAIEEDMPETPPEEAVATLGDEILDFYQPDEDLKLEDLVPDAHVPTPEQILESRDLQRYVNETLALRRRRGETPCAS